jgi:hypothetical protein
VTGVVALRSKWAAGKARRKRHLTLLGRADTSINSPGEHFLIPQKWQSEFICW